MSVSVHLQGGKNVHQLVSLKPALAAPLNDRPMGSRDADPTARRTGIRVPRTFMAGDGAAMAAAMAATTQLPAAEVRLVAPLLRFDLSAVAFCRHLKAVTDAVAPRTSAG